MSRIYSGILNDFRDATMRVQSLGMRLVAHEEWDELRRKTTLLLTIYDYHTNERFIEQEFGHHDPDVMTIEATSWLLRQYEDIKSWK